MDSDAKKIMVELVNWAIGQGFTPSSEANAAIMRLSRTNEQRESTAAAAKRGYNDRGGPERP